MPGHYLDFEAPAPRSHAADRARNDANRWTEFSKAPGVLSTWFNDETQRWGYQIKDADGRPLMAGAGWFTENDARDAGSEWIVT